MSVNHLLLSDESNLNKKTKNNFERQKQTNTDISILYRSE